MPFLTTLPDPAGYFYRYYLPQSLLRRRARENGQKKAAVEKTPAATPMN